MPNTVLLLEDDRSCLQTIKKLLESENLAVFGTQDIEEAAESLFSKTPPQIFITDYKYNRPLTQASFKQYQAGSFLQDLDPFELITKLQKHNSSTRTILISGLLLEGVSTKTRIFAYASKPISNIEDNSLSRLVEACRLGSLLAAEKDAFGKLRVGPFDLRSESFQAYCESFKVRQGQERK